VNASDSQYPRNRLLAALPDTDYRRLEPHLEGVELPAGKVISELGEQITHVFFPTNGIVSTLAILGAERPVEVAITGNEGMIGISTLLEGPGSPSLMRRSVVQVAGHAYRLRADLLMNEFERGGKLRHGLLRYTQALITQIAQIAVCNRHHALEAQVCRWLLQRLDRLAGNELQVTHKEIANLLGVRREGVTEVACQLQDAGLIRYSRGHVVVLERSGIEQRVCECFGVIQKEYARLLGQ
jgi:CRP-like cAMP-binding protein